MKKWSIVATAAVLGLASAAFGGVHAAEKLKVGFIYLGPIGDLGWTYQHDVSRKAMEQALGDKIETTYIENSRKAPTPNAPSSSWYAPATSSSSPHHSATWTPR
jgi:simple sugar transport system substrate-binding protein